MHRSLGATITLIGPDKAKELAHLEGSKIEDCEEITVTIANGTSEIINKKITSTLRINGVNTSATLYVMTLPKQYDILLGMDWMQQQDVWLSPRRKLLTLANEDGTRVVKSCLSQVFTDSTLPDYEQVATGSTVEGVYSVCRDLEVEIVKGARRQRMAWKKTKALRRCSQRTRHSVLSLDACLCSVPPAAPSPCAMPRESPNIRTM